MAWKRGISINFYKQTFIFEKKKFVIVSLKDGMFNNANVLFKTKLVDGVSTIQRYEQKKKTHDKEHHHALNDQTNLRHL